MAGMPFAVPINRIMLPGVPIYHENMAGEDAPSRRREVIYMSEAFEKYIQLKAEAEEAGIDYNACGLSQYLHISQVMCAEEEAWERHRKEMYEWLKNIENSIKRDINNLTNLRFSTERSGDSI